MLEIKDLQVSVENKQILKGVNLIVNPGEVHCIMGPNGAGKSTFVNSIMGHPKYEVLGGLVQMDGADVLDMEVFERACNGLFLAFQYPKEIAGVSMINFLLGAYNSQMQARDESFRPLKPLSLRR